MATKTGNPIADRAAAAAKVEKAREAARTVADLVADVKAYAGQHYNDGGWDVIVEAWDDAQIVDAIGGARTLAGAVKKLAPLVSVYADRQADAIVSAGAKAAPAKAAPKAAAGTADGKLTASRLVPGVAILVARTEAGALVPTSRKTGALVATVEKAPAPVRVRGERRVRLDIATDLGVVGAVVGAQTFWLAPAAKPAAAPAKAAPAAKVGPAKVAKAAPAKAAAKAAPKAAAPQREAQVTAPKGYTIRWVKASFVLAKPDEAGKPWLVICNHGAKAEAPTARAGEALGVKAQRAGWCKKCA